MKARRPRWHMSQLVRRQTMVKQQLNQTSMWMPLSALASQERVPSGARFCSVAFGPFKQHCGCGCSGAELCPDTWSPGDCCYFAGLCQKHFLSQFSVRSTLSHSVCGLSGHLASPSHGPLLVISSPIVCRGAERKRNRSIRLLWEQELQRKAQPLH